VADVLLGVTDGWFAHSGGSDAGPLPGEDGLRSILNEAGFGDVELLPIAGAAAVLAIASPRPAAARPAGRTAAVAIFAPRMETNSRYAAQIAAALEKSGRSVSRLYDGRSQHLGSGSMAVAIRDKASWATALASLCGETSGTTDVIHFAGSDRDKPSAALTSFILRFGAMLEGARAAAVRPRVWLVTQGAFASAADGAFAAAVWVSGRVAINEHPEIDIRLVDLAPDLDEADAATRLAELIAAPGTETEVLIDRQGVSVVRAAQGLPVPASAAPANAAAQLHLTTSPDRHEWRAVERVPPAPGEIELEVAATGVNFRDVMLAAGLLPDDIVADGLAGPTLGLECAGRVVRAGDGVAGIKPGDRVATFARGAFATHITVPAALALPIPASMPFEASATIPVAFLTAWYGLIHLAKLKRNEWVLIHAGAGGVGLAALQIARWRGARIVATAGSEDKRALLRLLGADVVLDSRSLAFADEIRRSIGGVHVVLNSLSGAAMEASLKVLKPFGRFVELGKRDYVANSRVGLRPFRYNLTYYGVDADQLLTQQRVLARKLTRDLSRLFASGALSPLPYRVYGAGDLAEAFTLMQRAGHVGKIVVRPPRTISAQRKSGAFAARAEGSHLVVGGTSGFGFATAQWLAGCGARTIVVASRRGALAPGLEDAAAELRARGVELIAAHVDVTRRDSVDWLIHWVESQHGPLAGIVHAAMVLDDAPMAGLDESRIAAVLAPKVEGALHLDQATRHAKLDYFVMYSSATTLIGNPGQASYVAANGFLEGLARRRRAENLPALAVAWGPIADAGVVARDRAAGSRLARRTGRAGMKARDALAHLGRLMIRDGGAADDAVVACAAIDWRAASSGLKILKTPLYSLLRADAAEGAVEAVDVAAMLHGKSDAEAREIVTGLVARQVAAILRVAAEDLDARRPLAEIGMDSLMGLELKMAVEDRFGIEVPLMAMTASKSVADIVTHMMAQLQPRRADESAAAGAPDERLISVRQGRPLLDQHGAGDLAPEGLDRLAEAVDQRRKATRRLAE
jgi:NADPH:quinone reductase-like Zn-dependent oxidoreductase/acyl carrier protein